MRLTEQITIKSATAGFLIFFSFSALLCFFSEKNIPLLFVLFFSCLPCFFIVSYYTGLIPTLTVSLFAAAPVLTYHFPLPYSFEASLVIIILLLPVLIVRPPTTVEIMPLLTPFFGYVVMLTGFTVSFFHSTSLYGEQWLFPFSFDLRFIIGMLYSLAVFMLLIKKTLSATVLTYGLITGAVVFWAVAAVGFISENGIASFFTTRFGTGRINANAISSLIELVLPFSVLWALKATSAPRRILCSVISIVFLLSIIFTQSRGGFLMIVILAGYLFYAEIFKKKQWVAGIAIALICSPLIPILANGVLLRLTKLKAVDVMSDVIRLYIYKAAILMIQANNYVFGVGMNGFSILKYNYDFPKFFGGTEGFSAHNQFLEIWVSWGILGLIGWLIVIISTLAGLMKTAKPDKNAISLACIFSLLFYFLHGFFDSEIASFIISFFHFSVLGLAFYCISSAGSGDQKHAL